MSAEGQVIRIALAGNPNCGKTTIFNNITGAKQHVGNYPGVTVEKKEGEHVFNGRDLLFIDLPGTYSLTARSLDELVARNVIINDEPDVIVNVVDASNLERNLYLTAQLLELEKPMVVVLNMADVAKEMGIHYDVKRISELTGATVEETIGRTNIGTEAVLEAIIRTADTAKGPTAVVDYGDVIEPKVEELMQSLKDAGSVKYPLRWVAAKLLEGDADVIEKISGLPNTSDVLAKCEELRAQIADTVDLDTVFQEQRHRFATNTFNRVLTAAVVPQETQSDKIDKVLTHRVLGFPIFLLIMWLLFNLVNTVGAVPQGWIEDGIAALSDWANGALPDGNLRSLIVDGIIAGVGAVLSFLPLIILLFLGISFLEDTGYMARAAFLMDRLMRSFGLHGKSFIPLLLGFGCSIPSIMGSRILDNRKDRMITILVTPFMSCSARLPVYVLMASAFFPAEYGGTVLFLTYAFGVVMAIIVAKLFRKTLFSGESEPFVMEMPPYHMPTVKAILMHMWERSWMYIKKAGTFILGATILFWFLLSYPQDVEYSQDYDAAREQVEQNYAMKDDAVLTQFGLTTDEQKEGIVALVEEMKGIGEEGIAAAEEDAAAAEEAGEEPKEVPELAGMALEEAPDFFGEFKTTHEKEFPVAWALYQNSLAMDAEQAELDLQQNSEKTGQSYAAIVGKALDPVLAPLGFNWKMGVSLIAGLTAKEVIISTIAIIYAVDGDDVNQAPISEFLSQDPEFTPLIAVAFLAFIVIYPPCLAALAVIKRETNSWKWMWFAAGYGIALAYIVSLVIYQGGKLLGFE